MATIEKDEYTLEELEKIIPTKYDLIVDETIEHYKKCGRYNEILKEDMDICLYEYDYEFIHAGKDRYDKDGNIVYIPDNEHYE